MIKEKKYKEALKVISEYEKQQNKEFVETYICAVCQSNKIEPIYKEDVKPLYQEQAMWYNGVVNRLTPGYGSSHDLSKFYFAVCDNCITELKKKKIIKDLKDIKSKLNKR